MSRPNINDPESVSALLHQLQASKAWKDLVASSSEVQQPETISNSSSSVAALLSQLKSSPSPSASAPPHNSVPHSAPPLSLPVPVRSHAPPSTDQLQDVKSFSYQQALPLLAQFSGDPAFVAQIQQMKKDQDDLERRLWEERRAIQRKHEDKVKIAKTKAAMIGIGLSKHEADMINDAYKKELDKFDRDRVLSAWDGLVTKQQTLLQQLNVPTMFVTNDKSTRERQQRVMHVLEGLVDNQPP
ncbi:hypothetical protein AMATHDRAFT_46121 [Amanita thiersii Skay4041]|uniref:Uncharacterized protein n=1 Tax=Amanita thiersii Skay4041 TaxID=703135 RepID=A0A2A9NR29_9AGAR|nr:hypothetical protein AMATHDRAFT_46121 [Amanita thiersii Skay4041]